MSGSERSEAEAGSAPAAGRAPDRPGRPLRMIKLGGSLITDKSRHECDRPGVLRRLAREVAETREPGALVIGHGSGSFGHPAAKRHGLEALDGERGDREVAAQERSGRKPGPMGVSAVQDRAAELHLRVVAALREAGVPAFSLPPSASTVARSGSLDWSGGDPLETALEGELVPVVYGDVVLNRRRGAVVASTETVLLGVARGLHQRGWRVTAILWLGDTPGVLDAEGRTVERLDGTGVSGLEDVLGGARATDVTGGMSHRIRVARELAREGVPSWVSDGREAGLLRTWLETGRAPGTRVTAGRAAGRR